MTTARDFRPALPGTPLSRRLILAGLGVWLALQVLVPMRHHLYPGDTSWTEQGHRFAWQMKLRDKQSIARFTLRDPGTGTVWVVDPREFLSRRQIVKMSNRPDMILQFAHFLADEWRDRHDVADPVVLAFVVTSLNGRPPSHLIDPRVNLAEVPRSLAPADWILPHGAHPVLAPAATPEASPAAPNEKSRP